MGICSSQIQFTGELQMNVYNSDIREGDISGEINAKKVNQLNTIFAHVNLIGCEQYTYKGVQTKNIFLNEKLQASLLVNQEGSILFQSKNPIQFKNISSNYSILPEYYFSTLLYLECYFAKSQRGNSDDAMQNTRRIFVIKVKQPKREAEPINLIYEKQIAGFSPSIIFRVDRNQFRIGDVLRGLLIADNSRSNQSIISNKLTIIQVIEIKQIGNQQYKRLTPQVMHQQKLDNINSEKKTLIINIAINESYQDAWSYCGELYKIKYILQVEITWENNLIQTLADEIFIINETN